jgi:hypothetical protein
LKTKDIFLVLIINFAFGLAFISAKVGVGEFPPFLFTAMRFLIIAVLLIPFLKIHQGQMLNILIISILGGGIHFSFFSMSFKTVGSKIKIITPEKANNIPNTLLQRITSFKKITERIVAKGTPNCKTIAIEEIYLELSNAK